MTTLLYAGGMFLGDKLVTDSDATAIGNMVSKIKMINLHKNKKAKAVVGCVGDAFLNEEYIDALVNGGDIDLQDGGTIILITRNMVREFSTGHAKGIDYDLDQVMAWGSGRKYAIGAYHACKDPFKAMSIAMQFDPSSGGGCTGFDMIEVFKGKGLKEPQEYDL